MNNQLCMYIIITSAPFPHPPPRLSCAVEPISVKLAYSMRDIFITLLMQ